MESYKKISIKARDVKPGDILYLKETRKLPSTMTVKEVVLTHEVIHITSTKNLTYHFLPYHTFLKELSPAEEGELAFQAEIDHAADEGPYGRNI